MVIVSQPHTCVMVELFTAMMVLVDDKQKGLSMLYNVLMMDFRYL